MSYTIQAPQRINATIQLPSSKSISNRVLIMNELAGRCCSLENLSDCDDTAVMQRALSHPSALTDIHAAGTAMRFLTAYYASTRHCTTITGSERMKHRPIGILVDALRNLGADITYTGNEGFPPLFIRGKALEGGEIHLSGSTSSQYISALMMLSPYMRKGLTIHITGDIISQTYILMTARLMQQFGAEVVIKDDRTLHIPSGQYQKPSFTIENDWSGASYWYETVALCQDEDCSIFLPGLYEDSLQGDSEIRNLFAPLGVSTQFNSQGVVLHKSSDHCLSYERDLRNQPDLAQTIVVTCSLSGIPFHITGLQTLKIKETDRLSALTQELGKLGIHIEEENGNALKWDGNRHPHPEGTPVIDTYDDHRMAMAFAPCALRIPKIGINNPEVVSKSYPLFWKDLEQAGFQIQNA